MKTRADLLIEAGNSIKMQEAAGVIEPVCKFKGVLSNMGNLVFTSPPEKYSFPLAVVEGRPVFEGDELYWKTEGAQLLWGLGLKERHFANMTWTKPKPKTVLVELTVDQAELITKYGLEYGITLACQKALEGVK